jgi:hypothetical protein
MRAASASSAAGDGMLLNLIEVLAHRVMHVAFCSLVDPATGLPPLSPTVGRQGDGSLASVDTSHTQHIPYPMQIGYRYTRDTH